MASLSPSSMVPSSLWSWVSGESVRRERRWHPSTSYTCPCAGGARMMSETSEIVSGSSTVRIMLNLVESLVTWCMLNCASTWRNHRSGSRAPEKPEVYNFRRRSRLVREPIAWEERVSDKLLEWVVLTWLGSVCSWNMLAVASATTLTVSSWRVLPWWVWIGRILVLILLPDRETALFVILEHSRARKPLRRMFFFLAPKIGQSTSCACYCSFG
ncbi:unnamed protein product [Trichogramma brassicae]|uniref:Uncharacterized protein n=1 Tax=Trichogramma brassicae TaxID=86971 RepID=A0A6H5J4X3_9HYME|nr:unnamed protein product [Trichogramma brassicae]